MYSLRNWNYISKLAQDKGPGQIQTILPLKCDCPWEPRECCTAAHAPPFMSCLHSSVQLWTDFKAQRGLPGGSVVKNLLAYAGDVEDMVWFQGQKDPLEEGLATQYSCLKIPYTEEPDRLLSIGSQKVGHDCHTCTGSREAALNWEHVSHTGIWGLAELCLSLKNPSSTSSITVNELLCSLKYFRKKNILESI